MSLYAERDIENLPAYPDHVLAMTSESLHSKSAIAAELAFRDSLIESLREDVMCLSETIESLTED